MKIFFWNFTDDPCDSFPCKHGGTCTKLSDSTFSCSCVSGYDPSTNCASSKVCLFTPWVILQPMKTTTDRVYPPKKLPLKQQLERQPSSVSPVFLLLYCVSETREKRRLSPMKKWLSSAGHHSQQPLPLCVIEVKQWLLHVHVNDGIKFVNKPETCFLKHFTLFHLLLLPRNISSK